MINYTRHTLDNGLRIVHLHDPSTAMVATDVLYDVGSRDERPDLTGLAHLFEHLMFGGSVNIPDFDKEADRAGGSNNAWTSSDFTNFYTLFPAVNAATPFWLESDRMLGLDLTARTLDVQRNVVTEEFKEVCLNQPYGDLSHHLNRLIYTTHPYRWPTIGMDISHLARVTLDDAREWFETHYAPNNAVLSVVGNISLDDTLRLAEKWFGPIPRRNIAPRTYAPEPAVTAPRSALVYGGEKAPQTVIDMAFAMGGVHAPDYIPADLITDILASGRASLLYQELVMKDDLFVEADASIFGTVETGVLNVNARLRQDASDADIREACRRMREVLDRLCDAPPTAAQLGRAVNRSASDRQFSLINPENKAYTLARDTMLGIDTNATDEAYRAVTPEIIHANARRLLDPSRQMTLVYHAGESPAAT